MMPVSMTVHMMILIETILTILGAEVIIVSNGQLLALVASQFYGLANFRINLALVTSLS